jgi:hypothetical protein
LGVESVSDTQDTSRNNDVNVKSIFWGHFEKKHSGSGLSLRPITVFKILYVFVVIGGFEVVFSLLRLSRSRLRSQAILY